MESTVRGARFHVERGYLSDRNPGMEINIQWIGGWLPWVFLRLGPWYVGVGHHF